jgi:hypothetical protein
MAMSLGAIVLVEGLKHHDLKRLVP